MPICRTHARSDDTVPLKLIIILGHIVFSEQFDVSTQCILQS